ncbi:MAG: conserved rane protein of unknown function [Rhodospirillales bacterium]|jgi:uncharacterized membrane protein YoaK (UPF0700 family)|nr:conserved rane protein of unknown function [Rhodospirillales bacterium]
MNHVRVDASLQAIVAGSVDTIAFVGLYGLFTAHITGNFVLIGAAIAHPQLGVIAKLAALPMFMLAAATTNLFLAWRVKGGHDPARGVFAVEAVLLAAFMAVALWCGPFTSGDQPLAILAGLFGVSAMAVQNAASRSIFSALPPTTVMTGNVTQIVLDLVELRRGGAPAADAAARARIAKMLPAVLAFAAGAIAGGLGYALIGFAALALPIVATLALLVLHKQAS